MRRVLEYGWPFYILLVVSALVGGCGDDGDSGEAVGFEPFAETAIVRIIHLAPSAGTLSLRMERPSLEPTKSTVTGEMVGGAPEPRMLETDPLTYTAYTPSFFYASLPVSVLEFMDGEDVLHVGDLQALEVGKAYLAMLAESGGEVAVVNAPLWQFPEQPDGKAQVAVLLATADLGRLDIELSSGGTTAAVWAGLAFGQLVLDQPQALDPGQYALSIKTASGESLDALLPRELDLTANTYVQLIIAPAQSAGERPRLVMMVDGPGGVEVYPR